ncbi:MAG TPA: hypothetical protein VEL75_10610, partial [Candidatus Methylomirabilis sp.]|nr:hypothetical protein [Candidatus Methylomirabilis sp.]
PPGLGFNPRTIIARRAAAIGRRGGDSAPESVPVAASSAPPSGPEMALGFDDKGRGQWLTC